MSIIFIKNIKSLLKEKKKEAVFNNKLPPNFL